MSAHIHRPATASARALLLHSQLLVEICSCDVFRLNGSARWIKPRSIPAPIEVEFGVKEAARYLNLSRDLVYPLLGRHSLHGEKRDHPVEHWVVTDDWARPCPRTPQMRKARFRPALSAQSPGAQRV